MDVGAGVLYFSVLLASAILWAASDLAEFAVSLGSGSLLPGSFGLAALLALIRLLGPMLLDPLRVLAGTSLAVLEVGGDHDLAVRTSALVAAVRTVVRTDVPEFSTAPLAGLGPSLLARLAPFVPDRNALTAAPAGVRAVSTDLEPAVGRHRVGALPARVRVHAVAALAGRPLAGSDRLDLGHLGQGLGDRSRGLLHRNLHGVGRDASGQRNLRGLHAADVRHDRDTDGLRVRLRGVGHEAGDRRDRVAGPLVELGDESVQEAVGAGRERADETRIHETVEHVALLRR
jgi:hypothetical protein